MNIPPIIDVAGVLISSEIFTEFFCCDYEKCKGICCVEGDAGAPVTLDEIAAMEDALDGVWSQLSASAQSVIDRQGVAYADQDGDMVTSIVRGKTDFIKPISCALYPIREKTFSNGTTGLNYNRWAICHDAVEKGKALHMRVYQFLKEPLIRRFGKEWYDELCEVARQFNL